MNYGLWLLTNTDGHISLTGWSETASDKPDHWPTYLLCTDRAQLPTRLQETGLTLAAGADLGDLDKAWDVYLRHPDLPALRAQLDREKSPTH